MAAYAALISLENIIDSLQLHPHPPISLPEQLLLLLTQKVTFLQEFLQGYNLHDLAYTNEADPWEVRIADAAYAAEDAIESHIVDEITNDGEKMSSVKRGHGKNRFKNTINSFFKSWCSRTSPSRVPKMSWDALYQALDKVIQDMDLIHKEAIEINETTVSVQHQLPRKSTPSDSLRSSSSIAQNSSMVGVDDVKLQLMDKLTDGRPDLQIIPIVGMGGSGKTSLARNIYQQRLIEERFDICGWATISQQYSIREIFTEILRQLNQNLDQHLSEDVLGEKLYKRLCGRKYLIIMDDMWGIDVWDRVRYFFPNNKNGSRVVVTTRLSNLALELPGSDRLEMGFLDEADSWDLLSKTVFGEESCPLELEEIGKKIGKSCRGLPLSIVVVGGFLAMSNHTIQFWGYVEENLNSIVSLEDDERCLKVVNMSYKQLPIYLKPCFLYMGVFREDERIRVSKLIKLLVAEGFLKARNGMSMEETAREYLKDLIDRNLILVDELGSTGKIKDCKIHDVVREFCLREARKERFYYEVRPNTRGGIINGQRRIVINCRRVLEVSCWKKYLRPNTLRPVPLVRSYICNRWEEPFLDDFRLLRVLHTIRAARTNSRNMTQLVNSRYLAMRYVDELPSSTCRFWNLQTLFIGGTAIVPAEVWCMTQIRHIKLEAFTELPDPPASSEEDEMVLGNLQTLAWIENFKLSEDVVKRILNLRKLGLIYTNKRGREYSLSNLACLHKLESLVVLPIEDCVVNYLSLPPSLKKLTVSARLFNSWQDLWEEMGKLPLLEKLLLAFYDSGEDFGELETVEGTFPRLKFLGIHFAYDLEMWRMESSSHFPCLERLDLYNVWKLKEVPSELAEIATLGRIDVEYCNVSVGESAKRVVEIQEELYGESALQVRVSSPFPVEYLYESKTSVATLEFGT